MEASLSVKKDNHFLPQMYLKNWCNEQDKVFQYRKIVQHENVPIWKDYHPSAIGYSQYLYVNTQNGNPDDVLENWFDSNYEFPAKNSIDRVIRNEKLSRDDYKLLANFVALQDLRTPKRYFEHLERSDEKALSDIVEDVVNDVKSKIPPDFKPDGKARYHDSLPIKVEIEEDGNDAFIVKVTWLAGRASWLWSIKHVLTTVAEQLHQNSWTILHPANGMSWLTSDNPVVRLNYENEKSYDFNGGWANPNSEVFLPLGPRHLLYTQVGVSPPILRGTKLTVEQTRNINRMIAENCHNFVVSHEKRDDVELLIPRVVDKEKVETEKEHWKNWHLNHRDAELVFYGDKYV
ncbi:hypothetical protein DLH87_25135 [Vibrio parahaemolyticus]|nr:DUF4238 domain-containing protein [Vibrio parahaemolyticus]EGQ8893179.1 DUF4238 domain-containing protein [Vibrio parahaemolyticus]EGQ8967240.1 DUF4238 domain-containing protein [Vibrio parahaemolyticus]EGR2854965.1 DUF4238 domain-containing protein [Vibrio parahaemolyticus]EGR3169464.1 hypothetical protein [Vibrio parahaemolyticus]